MDIDKLRATVTELELQLQSLGSVDEASRIQLQDAIHEIRAALDEPGAVEPPVSSLTPVPSLTQGLKEAVEKFEVSHPTLTSVLGRLIDILGQMGI